MNDQEINDYVEYLKKLLDENDILDWSDIKDVIECIEQLQSELRAKDELIKDLERQCDQYASIAATYRNKVLNK